ncbi:major allergen alt [Trichoderma arundinaceum]|uniref:Major allergen alt n=1 Tax=Trichoderma arundinaceum TaxID=490622 RepID=A0A395NBA9_TRIAR|nr:major allergen alt [Trichoderma arundinaceum]
MRSETFAPLLALATSVLAGREERVKVSNLSVHKVGSPVGATIESISFRLSGDNAKDLECSASNFAFPEPIEMFPCGDSGYAFALFAGEDGVDFATMVYHDVGDLHADLRGHSNVDTLCDNSHGSGPADEICTQKNSVTFIIDGPVGSSPGDGAEL